jgi:iron complex transport system permease protein
MINPIHLEIERFGGKKSFRVFFLAFLFLGISIWMGLIWGSVQDVDIQVITQLRLPRVILALAIGMGLSVTGVSLQVLFANPLCEPYILGTSSGGALGAVIGSSLGLDSVLSGVAVPAFVGSLVFALILYWIARRSDAGTVSVLLAGVILGFLGSSLVTLWIALQDPNGLQNVLVWFFGDLSRARLSGSLLTLLAVFGWSCCIWAGWRQLDALLVGEEGAKALGVDTLRTRRHLIVYTALIIGLCVSAGGVIGFIGLVVPHVCRRWVGSLHWKLIPLTMIVGAAVLVMSDCFSRVVLAPQELPVGVVTAMLGSPIFLWILLSKRPASR